MCKDLENVKIKQSVLNEMLKSMVPTGFLQETVKNHKVIIVDDKTNEPIGELSIDFFEK